jgi:hypothetical protein
MPKRKKRRSVRGRPRLLAKLTIDQIQSEIARRRDALMSLRLELVSELAGINADLARFGDVGSPPARRGPGRPRKLAAPTGQRLGRGRKGRGRGGNEKSLPALLHSLLQGKTMSIPDLTDAAKKAGHKSKSKKFKTIVALAVFHNPKMFRRVSRGLYTAK